MSNPTPKPVAPTSSGPSSSGLSVSSNVIGPNFPDQFPAAEVMKFVELVRSGDFRKNQMELIKLGLWIAGCTLETFFEQGQSASILRARSPEYYAGQVDALAPLPGKEGEVSAQMIDPALIIAIIKLIMSLLEKKS